MDIDAELPLDTREQQIKVLSAIVWEALRIYVDGTIGDEPWTTQPRDVSGLDTAINALSEIREVRKAFPARAPAKAKRKAESDHRPLERQPGADEAAPLEPPA